MRVYFVCVCLSDVLFVVSLTAGAFLISLSVQL